jgi:molybdopterin-guanine dinucleotide biosynthesis protein B
MKVFGIAGHSGMGKTTLLERLIPELTGRGLSVSLIKHSHKSIDIDRPGKDSYRLREAGCGEVVLLGNERWALMHELRGAPEPSLDYLIGRLQPCDLVLVEGFKEGHFPKIEVWRHGLGRETLWPRWPGIMAIASDAGHNPADPQRGEPAPVWFDLADTRAIAQCVVEHAMAVGGRSGQ